MQEILNKGKKFYKNEIDKRFPDFSKISSPVIYGAGRMGQSFAKKLSFKVKVFCDANTDLWGKEILGIDVISPDELEAKYKDYPVLIASSLYETEIFDQLAQKGFSLLYPLSFLHHKNPDLFSAPEYDDFFDSIFKKENQLKIINCSNLWHDQRSKEDFLNVIKYRLTLDKDFLKKTFSDKKIYFDSDLIRLSDKEVFVDCGAYVGEVTQEFIRLVGNMFNKIHSFEPDRINFKKLIKVVGDKKVSFVNKGVGQKSEERLFDELGTIDSRLNGNGVLLPFTSLDEYFVNKEPPTFIKMDVEGGEIDALLGAAKLIKNRRPKLAISVYHKAADLWEIPLLIKELNSDYRLFLRHYSNATTDIVCYAY